MSVDINWLAVLVAALAAMVIGSLWYAPFLFGNTWKKLVGLSDKQIKAAGWMPMVVMAVLAVVQAVVLTHFIAFAGYFYPAESNTVIGLCVGAWAWVGFVLPALGGAYLFSQRPKEQLAIDAGNILVTLLAVGLILAVW